MVPRLVLYIYIIFIFTYLQKGGGVAQRGFSGFQNRKPKFINYTYCQIYTVQDKGMHINYAEVRRGYTKKIQDTFKVHKDHGDTANALNP